MENKIVIAQNIEQMITLIEDKYMIPRCFIDFINIEELEIKENVIDTEELACHLMHVLWKHYPDVVRQRYKIDMPEDTPGYELLEEAGRKRGFLLARGEIHTERMAKVLLDEYRSGKLGFFTLEKPEDAV